MAHEAAENANALRANQRTQRVESESDMRLRGVTRKLDVEAVPRPRCEREGLNLIEINTMLLERLKRAREVARMRAADVEAKRGLIECGGAVVALPKNNEALAGAAPNDGLDDEGWVQRAAAAVQGIVVFNEGDYSDA